MSIAYRARNRERERGDWSLGVADAAQTSRRLRRRRRHRLWKANGLDGQAGGLCRTR